MSLQVGATDQTNPHPQAKLPQRLDKGGRLSPSTCSIALGAEFSPAVRRSYSIKLVPSAHSAPSFPQLQQRCPASSSSHFQTCRGLRAQWERARGGRVARTFLGLFTPSFFLTDAHCSPPTFFFSLKSCCHTRVDGGRRGNELTVCQSSTVQGLKSTPRPASLIPRMFLRYPTVQARKMRPSLILSLDILASKFHPTQASLRVCLRGVGQLFSLKNKLKVFPGCSYGRR